MSSPESVCTTSKSGPEPIRLDKTSECPVCAIKARMLNPDRSPICGHRDYPADRLIDPILKYTPPGPNPVWNKTEEVAICGVVSVWCGRPEGRRFTSLTLCGECYARHLGVPFRDDDGWLLNSARHDVDAPAGNNQRFNRIN
ncbi:hypothetical protein CcaCcLH18_13960 [Colletotrichum camelliae]|nr:hypothetical protein CcaCcLH18_13960 [Colletotrichum camelliae]